MEGEVRHFLTAILAEMGRAAHDTSRVRVQLERLQGATILDKSEQHSYALLIEEAARQGLVELDLRETLALRLFRPERSPDEKTRIVMPDLTGRDLGLLFSSDRDGGSRARRISLFDRHQRLFDPGDFWVFKRVPKTAVAST